MRCALPFTLEPLHCTSDTSEVGVRALTARSTSGDRLTQQWRWASSDQIYVRNAHSIQHIKKRWCCRVAVQGLWAGGVHPPGTLRRRDERVHCTGQQALLRQELPHTGAPSAILRIQLSHLRSSTGHRNAWASISASGCDRSSVCAQILLGYTAGLAIRKWTISYRNAAVPAFG